MKSRESSELFVEIVLRTGNPLFARYYINRLLSLYGRASRLEYIIYDRLTENATLIFTVSLDQIDPRAIAQLAEIVRSMFTYVSRHYSFFVTTVGFTCRVEFPINNMHLSEVKTFRSAIYRDLLLPAIRDLAVRSNLKIVRNDSTVSHIVVHDPERGITISFMFDIVSSKRNNLFYLLVSTVKHPTLIMPDNVLYFTRILNWVVEKYVPHICELVINLVGQIRNLADVISMLM